MTILKLEVGKIYRTRSGRRAVVTDYFPTPGEPRPYVGCVIGGGGGGKTWCWKPDGTDALGGDGCYENYAFDLIAQWGGSPADDHPTRAEFDALKAEVEAMKSGAEPVGKIATYFAWEDTREGPDYWRAIAGRLYQIATDGKL